MESVRRAINNFPVNQNVAVYDTLSGRVNCRGKSAAVDSGIKPEFKVAKELLIGLSPAFFGIDERQMQLFLAQSVIDLESLFLKEQSSECGKFVFGSFPVLSGRIGPFVARTFCFSPDACT
jgi:hypothetical protein